MFVEQKGAKTRGPAENYKGADPEILPREKVRVLIPHSDEFARYNAAVIEDTGGSDDLLILIREVPRANIKPGIPDKGNLVIYRSTPEKVERIGQLDLSHPAISGWEDPRAFKSDKATVDAQGVKSEDFFMGLTAIRASDNSPVAATVRGKITNGNLSVDHESLHVYPNDTGKNVTPISLTKFLFRRKDSNHSLEVVQHGTDEDGRNKLDVKKIIHFPKKPWCEWLIGTQAQILPGGILPIHGVNIRKTHKGNDQYEYSMGLAQLDENFNVVKTTDIPLFTRESFKNILPMGIELNPEKNVIYCCGYSIRGNIVKFVISIGDLMTVEVSISMTELRKKLDKSPSVVFKRIPKAIAV